MSPSAEEIRRWSRLWRANFRANLRHARRENFISERQAIRQAEQETEGWLGRTIRWFNRAMSPEYSYEGEDARAWEEAEENIRLRRHQENIDRATRNAPRDTRPWLERNENKLIGSIIAGAGGAAYAGVSWAADEFGKWTDQYLNPPPVHQTGTSTSYIPKVPQPDQTSPGDNMGKGSQGGGAAAGDEKSNKRRREDDDDGMRDSQASAGGGSVSVNMSQRGAPARASGFGGIGIAAAIGNSIMSTPGRRNHNLLASLDEFKHKGRKRAKSGFSRLFEAAEPWVPFHLQVVQTAEPVPLGTIPDWPNLVGQWRSTLIARSRCTYGSVLHLASAAVPSGAATLWDSPFVRCGIFASLPATTTVGGVTPGMRSTANPHIGKLIVNGSIQFNWYNSETNVNLPIAEAEAQIHLVRFSNQSSKEVASENVMQTALDIMTGWLDASDFDLGVGIESFVNGVMITEQAAIAPAGTNGIITQEEHLYPPRRNYKVHWSSPIFTLNRLVNGNQTSLNQAPASAAPDVCYAPRLDLTNIEIPIDRTISFNEGATAELNDQATNRGDPFNNFQFVITAKPRLTPTSMFARSVSDFLMPYDETVRFSPTGSLTYIYNFRDDVN